jgi:hypothetical protein
VKAITHELGFDGMMQWLKASKDGYQQTFFQRL